MSQKLSELQPFKVVQKIVGHVLYASDQQTKARFWKPFSIAFRWCASIWDNSKKYIVNFVFNAGSKIPLRKSKLLKFVIFCQNLIFIRNLYITCCYQVYNCPETKFCTFWHWSIVSVHQITILNMNYTIFMHNMPVNGSLSWVWKSDVLLLECYIAFWNRE